MSTRTHRSVPGLDADKAAALTTTLQDRLVGTLDLQLVLKHVHWNVVGPNFLSVHEMLDDQVESVREMSDELAERIATLGGTPNGNSGAIVSQRTWNDYPLGRSSVSSHLEELEAAYTGVIGDHRTAIARASELDPVTEDMLIGQTARLEMFQWFIRSFIEQAQEPGSTTRLSPATTAAEDRAAHQPHVAGRGPTESEASAADENAADVDLDAVEEPYREMTGIDASVKGEGSIG